MVVAPDLSNASLRGRANKVDGAAAFGARPVFFGPGDIELDYVGSVSNAATVIASLHRGEKRLVFCDSRQLVEEIGAALREGGESPTFLSHASLPLLRAAPR